MTTMSQPKNLHIDDASVKQNLLAFAQKYRPRTKLPVELTTYDMVGKINKSYVMVPEFCGVRTLIVITKYQKKYYSVNFPDVSDRYREKNGFKLYPITNGIKSCVYQGTVMEGVFTQYQSSRCLIIDDIYHYCGRDVSSLVYTSRLKLIDEFVNNNIEHVINFNIYSAATYPLNESSMIRLIDNLKGNTNIRKIYFVPPELNNIKYYYIILDSDLADDVIRITNLTLSKTSNKNVYNLHQQKQFMGLAYIPSIKLEKEIVSWFKNAKSEKISVKCQYDNDKQKWIPVELLKKHPHN
jgi:hypothetical protein